MNHIKKLEVVAASYTEQILDARDSLNNLRAYLQSDKFHTDTTVQVQDVLNRLEPLRECLSETYYEIKEEKYKNLV
jgi:predicted component of type VI protein secretion system